MTVEEIVGRRVAKLREAKALSQAELGRLLGDYLDRPWQRQAVWSGEQGKRALTAAELFALSYILRTRSASCSDRPRALSRSSCRTAR